MMQTGYSGAKGNCPRYVCARAKQLYGGEQGCQSIGGRRLEQRVLDELFTVLEPAALAATGQGADRRRTGPRRARCARSSWPSSGPATKPTGPAASTTRSSRRTGWSPAPWNARWEDKLAAQRQAEHDLLAQQARRPVQLTDDELAWLTRAGADVRAVFNAPTTTFRERKQLLRAVITEVVVTVDTAAPDRRDCGSSGKAAPAPS